VVAQDRHALACVSSKYIGDLALCERGPATPQLRSLPRLGRPERWLQVFVVACQPIGEVRFS